MDVKKVMTESCEFIAPDSTLEEAARKMRELDCGFLPIGSESRGRLEGVVTDRDIVLRAVAEGKSPAHTQVREAETSRVLYCYEGDSLDDAARTMRVQQVYRLIVLDNAESKQLRGVISLGDILRHNEQPLAADTASGIAERAA